MRSSSRTDCGAQLITSWKTMLCGFSSSNKWRNWSKIVCSYRLLRCSLVGFDLQLEFVHHILETGQVLTILLSLVGELLDASLIFANSFDGVTALPLLCFYLDLQLSHLRNNAISTTGSTWVNAKQTKKITFLTQKPAESKHFCWDGPECIVLWCTILSFLYN